MGNQWPAVEESLDQWEEMKLREETKKKLLRDNAVELFD